MRVRRRRVLFEVAAAPAEKGSADDAGLSDSDEENCEWRIVIIANDWRTGEKN